MGDDKKGGKDDKDGKKGGKDGDKADEELAPGTTAPASGASAQGGYVAGDAAPVAAIQILTLVGDSYEVEFSDDYSLGDFKVAVGKKSGVTPIMQRLILGEKLLRGDSEKIVDL